MSKEIKNPLEALQGSLQAEFELFAQHDWASDLLKAKKRQLELLHQLSNVTHEVKLGVRVDKPVFKWIDGKPQVNFKLVSPSMWEGVER